MSLIDFDNILEIDDITNGFYEIGEVATLRFEIFEWWRNAKDGTE